MQLGVICAHMVDFCRPSHKFSVRILLYIIGNLAGKIASESSNSTEVSPVKYLRYMMIPYFTVKKLIICIRTSKHLNKNYDDVNHLICMCTQRHAYTHLKFLSL